jgi:hypothetical protein
MFHLKQPEANTISVSELQLLHDHEISFESLGTILKNFQMLLDFIGTMEFNVYHR